MLFQFAQYLHPRDGDTLLVEQPLEDLFTSPKTEVLRRVLTKDLLEAVLRDVPLLQEAYATTPYPAKDDPTILLAWWKEYGPALGAWNDLFNLYILLQPSSAAAERVFSVYTTCLSAGQRANELEETQQAQIKLRVMSKVNK